MIRLVPRGVLDITWNHLLSSLLQTLFLNSNCDAPNTPGILATLSVRSAFDLYLQDLKAESRAHPGDEIIMSAVSIPEMFAIAEAHQFKVIPVPIRFSDLTVRVDEIQAAISSRTRAILIAPLFGVRFSLKDVAKLAAAHGILLLEDCAQAWHGYTTLNDFQSVESDVSDFQSSGVTQDAAVVQLYSFGPIKTSTALGGAVVVDPDSDRLSRLRSLQSRYPRVPRRKSLQRLIRYLFLKRLSTPLCFGLFAKSCSFWNKDYDDVLFRMTRGFPGASLPEKFRYQLNSSQQHLLARRFSEPHHHWIRQRNQYATELLSLLDRTHVPGMSASISNQRRIHNHWAIPYESSNPVSLISDLRRAGFDATQRASSLIHYDGPESEQPHTNETDTLTATRLANLVYLPNYPAMKSKDLYHMATIINDHQSLNR